MKVREVRIGQAADRELSGVVTTEAATCTFLLLNEQGSGPSYIFGYTDVYTITKRPRRNAKPVKFEVKARQNYAGCPINIAGVLLPLVTNERHLASGSGQLI